MADPREQILARLAVVCAGVTGVAAVARNALDVPGLARPAIVMHDGSEAIRLGLEGRRYRSSERQMMELSPQVTLLLDESAARSGGTFSLYRGRIAYAVCADATLQSLVTTNGEIRFEGMAVNPPDPEAKFRSADINFAFVYPFRLSDFAP